MISTPAYTPSPIERLTNGRWKPISTIRLLTVLAMIPCVLSLTVFTTGNAHAFCGGATFGLLIGLLAQSFARQAPSRD